MPNVTAIPRNMSNGDIVTEFNDTIGTSTVTYTYSDQQESLRVTNRGSASLTLTVNSTNYTIQPNQNQIVNTSFLAFSIVSASGVQPFETRTTNMDTDTLKGHVQISGHRWTYNTDEGLRKFRSALAKVKVGNLTYLDIPIIGDSITEGVGAGAGTNNDYLTKGYVGRMRSFLANKYTDVGTGFIPLYYPYNTTSTGGTGFWTFAGTGWVNSAYGFVAKSTTTNGDTATITFTGAGLGIVVYQGAIGANFTVTIDGGTPNNLSCFSGTGNRAAKLEITGLSAGTHTAVIKHNDTTGSKILFLSGAYAINGTSGIRPHMFGHSGYKANDFTTSDMGMETAIDLWNAPLHIISLGANEYLNNVSPSTYETNIQTLITRCMKYGDVLLVSSGLATDIRTYQQSEFNQVLMKLAIKNNTAYVDVFNRWSADANFAKNTLGLINDNVHPNDVGHQDMATSILSAILEYAA